MFQIAKDVLDERQYKFFHSHGQIDFAYDYDDDNRFRVNLFMARGKPSLAARLITSNIKDFDSLYLPPILGEVAMSATGLILFSGVTGSGKSTSIASMLQYINERRRVHIVTIEDPIEYIFKDAKSTINQREVGIDTRVTSMMRSEHLCEKIQMLYLLVKCVTTRLLKLLFVLLRQVTLCMEQSMLPVHGRPLAASMTSSQKVNAIRFASFWPTISARLCIKNYCQHSMSTFRGFQQ